MVGTTLVVETFKKTVLQCFCKTCQVPNVEKKVLQQPSTGRPAAACVVRKPPKKVAFLATEVRCSEQSKGGLKYELVLSEPALESPKLTAHSPPKANLSIEDIENKLKAAEERRQSVELQKLSFVCEQLNHLNEVKGKREEFDSQFKTAVRENLEQKLEAMKENRETHIKTIKEKARDVVLKVDEKRKIIDSPAKEEKLEAINKKLMVAQEQREAFLNSLQERLKEHDKHIMEVKKQMEEQTENLREKSIKKLEVAQVKRETLLKEIQEKMKEHERHIEEVRQKAMSVSLDDNCKEILSG
ncbi:golgin subfamily A member 6-like protein 1 [Uloborus diversus]|uniref:golgin subfamily A member 6-like protein 1 n=1 Tax=Uloborus diversus TaxID=327109 RepID=UPI002409C29F|nr:golgin subfamily A member 6-like protein 1 [Uloborus diversus]